MGRSVVRFVYGPAQPTIASHCWTSRIAEWVRTLILLGRSESDVLTELFFIKYWLLVYGPRGGHDELTELWAIRIQTSGKTQKA